MNGSIALSLKRINVFAGEGYKHMADKACLGLPRKIHGPWDKPLRHRQSWKPGNHRMIWRAKRHTLCLPFAYSYFKRKRLLYRAVVGVSSSLHLPK